MARQVSRKDPQKRALKTNEYVRPDGRYSYSYTFAGKRRSVYARTLKELRDKEAEIQAEISRGITPGIADRMSINEVFDAYMETRMDLKRATKAGYISTYSLYVRKEFGKLKLKEVKHYHVVTYYRDLMEKGLSRNTIKRVHNLLTPTFTFAIRNEFITLNPCSGALTGISRCYDETEGRREALSREQEKAFMQFLDEHKEFAGWYGLLVLLQQSGLRIGEALALRWTQLDFEKMTLQVDSTFSYRQYENGCMERHITSPKTRESKRTIPLSKKAAQALKEEYELQLLTTGLCSETIDGYSNFVFANEMGTLLTPSSVNRAIERILTAYNEYEGKRAEEENREPLLIPHISAHVFRHCVATRLTENGVLPVVIRSILGHQKEVTTLDRYTTVSMEMMREAIDTLN